MSSLTLAHWLKAWPHVGRNITDGKLGPIGEAPNGTDPYVVADASHGSRTTAFDLTDYLVSSVASGSLWFIPRK